MGPEPPPVDQALPCRPTIACTAEIVAPGAFEIESGLLYRRLADGVNQLTTPVLFKQSFTSRFQLQVGTNGATFATAGTRYLDDVYVGPKVVITEQSARAPAVSASAAVSVPTFRGRGYVRTDDVLLTGYVTKDVGPIHADLNLAADVLRVDDRPKVQPWTALALSWDLPATFGGMVEGYAFADAAPLAKRDGGLLLALSESPRPWLVFDAGGDLGFYPSTRSYALFVGATFVPVVLGR